MLLNELSKVCGFCGVVNLYPSPLESTTITMAGVEYLYHVPIFSMVNHILEFKPYAQYRCFIAQILTGKLDKSITATKLTIQG